jgi:hypothetical protein
MTTNMQYFSGDVRIHGQTNTTTTTSGATSWASTIASTDGRVVAEERLAVVRGGTGSTTEWYAVNGTDVGTTITSTYYKASLVGITAGESGIFRNIAADQASTPSTVVIRDTAGGIYVTNINSTSTVFNLYLSTNGGGGMLVCSCSSTAANNTYTNGVTLLDFDLGTRTVSGTGSTGNLSLAARGSVSLGYFNPTSSVTGWGSFDVEFRAGAAGNTTTAPSTIVFPATVPNQFSRIGKSLDSNLTSCDLYLTSASGTGTPATSRLLVKAIQENAAYGAYWAGLFSFIEMHP